MDERMRAGTTRKTESEKEGGRQRAGGTAIENEIPSPLKGTPGRRTWHDI